MRSQPPLPESSAFSKTPKKGLAPGFRRIGIGPNASGTTARHRTSEAPGPQHGPSGADSSAEHGFPCGPTCPPPSTTTAGRSPRSHGERARNRRCRGTEPAATTGRPGKHQGRRSRHPSGPRKRPTPFPVPDPCRKRDVSDHHPKNRSAEPGYFRTRAGPRRPDRFRRDRPKRPGGRRGGRPRPPPRPPL
jgi:hypothetical protein